MSGADPKQLFDAMLPSCKKQILLGINQSTMATSVWCYCCNYWRDSRYWLEVLYYIRKAEVGQSLVVGVVIALMAIIIDRITWVS